LNPPDTNGRCAAQLPAGYLEDDEPVFHEPWQAQAFALAVHLIESGTITWDEWAATLGEEIARAGEREDGSGYYELWLRALERLVMRAELVEASELSGLKEAWRRAYEGTPHGQPVRLAER
jgi:nitrile hydratase accessory protein